jgi:hypothetical protein
MVSDEDLSLRVTLPAVLFCWVPEELVLVKVLLREGWLVSLIRGSVVLELLLSRL